MSVPVFTVDAFATRPFSGNPAAVCLLDGPADAAWMQQVAAEMNLSETAFAHPVGAGYALRWFTPLAEIALCGHATLATAHVLWETGRVAAGAGIRFDTASGALRARATSARIEIDLPSDPPQECEPPPALVTALGRTPRTTARTSIRWLAELGSPEEVRELQPDTRAIQALGGQGLIVTAAGGTDGHDFTSRYFAPAIGIAEDPVTGAAHCCLTPFWTARLGAGELVGYQASRRGGEVRVRLDGDRVILGGKAVTVVAGTLVAE